MRRLPGCVIVLAGLLLSGCAELRALHQNSTSTAPSRAQSEQTSLLLSLRNDPNYGVIQYADVEVLYRDLTKVHPSSVDNEAKKDLSLLSPSTEESVTERAVSEWKQDTTHGEYVATLIPEMQFEAPFNPASITRGISAASNRKLTESSVVEAAESVDTRLSRDCEAADSVKVSDEIWLASRQPERWTIQISSSPDAQAHCLDTESLSAMDAIGARRFSVYFKNRLWNIVVIGDFASADEALMAASDFNEPWIREIGELRERRCNSVNHMSQKLQIQLRRWCSGKMITHETLSSVVARPREANVSALTVRSPYAR